MLSRTEGDPRAFFVTPPRHGAAREGREKNGAHMKIFPLSLFAVPEAVGVKSTVTVAGNEAWVRAGSRRP